jgi:hypothetical protein
MLTRLIAASRSGRHEEAYDGHEVPPRLEREVFASLLLRVADEQGLTRGVHPGFAKLRPQGERALNSGARESKLEK